MPIVSNFPSGAGGVKTFNGRKGGVKPQAGDYTADMVTFADGQTFQQKYDAGELTGPDGAPGKDGAPGAPGATGATGSPGKDGAPGQKGDPGEQGPPGKDGRNGSTFTPSVSSAGDLSWTNDGGLPNPGTVNIRGPVGPKGADGKDGAAGPPGQPPSTFPATAITGTVSVSKGGTGRSTLTSGAFLRGNGTGLVTLTSLAALKTELGIGSGVEIVYGTYAGNSRDSVTQTITLGFRPKMVLVFAAGELIQNVSYQYEDYDDVEYGSLYFRRIFDDVTSCVIVDGFTIEAWDGKDPDDVKITVAEIVANGFVVGNSDHMDNTETSRYIRDEDRETNLNYLNMDYVYLAVK